MEGIVATAKVRKCDNRGMQMTRRQWLAGAAATPLRLPKAIRVGIAGLDGHIAEVLEPLPELPDVTLAAVGGEAELKRPSFPGSPAIYRGWREMLDKEKLDVVAVCGPNDERAEAIIECARRGIHVVAEKPLAVERRDFESVRDAVKKSGIKLTMLLPMRFDPQYLAMKELVRSGELGEIAQIHSQKSYQLGPRPKWQMSRKRFGGSIPFIGIHMVDLMRWSSGREFVEVMSYQSHLGFPEYGEMENTAGSLFRLDNGGVAVMHLDYLRPDTAPKHGDDRLRLVGTKGIAEFMDSSGLTVMSGTRKPEKITSLPAKQSLFRDFLEATYQGKPAGLALEEIYRVNEIVFAAREAAEGRKLTAIPVKIKG